MTGVIDINEFYLAIDIGASSGRHILGYIQDGKLCLEEIYRFENGFFEENGSLVWNVEHLVNEVKNGIKKCSEIGKIPKTLAIDTWGVDYVLLDEEKNLINPTFCYRDSRTEKSIPLCEGIVPLDELYRKTGIQKTSYNTIYQLYADKLSGKIDKAKYFLMIPEFLSFALTGVIKKEYTNASTTALINAEEKNWDFDIIDKLNLPRELFSKLYMPTEFIGGFSADVKSFVGFDCNVVFAASHDTASAVISTPLEDNDIYISSGTWSLIGIESEKPLINDKIYKANFSNEGGIDYRYRFLKNYIGMWFLQSIKRGLDNKLSYDEMMKLAQESTNYKYFDVNDNSFLAPDNMIDSIKTYFGDNKMPLQDVIASAYHSLARSYNAAVCEIEGLTGKNVGAIHIVGGGSKDSFLNTLTSTYTGKPVTAGPVEATAIGNIAVQLIANGICNDLPSVRKLIKKSFDIFTI